MELQTTDVPLPDGRCYIKKTLSVSFHMYTWIGCKLNSIVEFAQVERKHFADSIV